MSVRCTQFVLVAAALVGLFACSGQIIAQSDLDQKLIAAIEREKAAEEQVTVRMKDLTTFEWDKFYVFVPYNMREEDLREILGMVPQSSIISNDWDDLLVFVKSGKVVHYHDHPRKHGDFDGLSGRNGYSPDEAVFEVSFDKAPGWLVLRPLKSSSLSASN
jgi:hypothetical protein